MCEQGTNIVVAFAFAVLSGTMTAFFSLGFIGFVIAALWYRESDLFALGITMSFIPACVFLIIFLSSSYVYSTCRSNREPTIKRSDSVMLPTKTQEFPCPMK